MTHQSAFTEKMNLPTISAPSILIIEEDSKLNRALAKHFIAEQYEVDAAFDSDQGWKMVNANTYDVVVLNWELSKVDGLTFCERLRRQGYKGAVVLTTNKNTTEAKIAGLDSGADDYIIKPIDFPEFSARIRAILRRNPEHKNSIINFRGLVLDSSNYRVTANGQPVTLTPTEYRLLNFFLHNPNRILSDEELLANIWNTQERNGYELVKAHIKGLRRNLRAAGVTEEIVETVRGAGYRLVIS